MGVIEERNALYWLCHVPEVGAVTIRHLYQVYGSYQRIYNIEGKELCERSLLSARKSAFFQRAKSEWSVWMEEKKKLEEKGIRFMIEQDPDYPQRLKQIPDRPAVLFVKGSLPPDSEPAAAIVGARNCTNYGSRMAHDAAAGLSAAGVHIISGLAYGIDEAAHAGALKAGYPTYGILGCGIDICYPRENYKLYCQMGTQGGIITEFMPGSSPVPGNFPMRNRIISGLADVILVMEAREKSGSLITAELGLEQGKEIFALPGRVNDPLSEGCNRLIKDGAVPILTIEDVLEYFSIRQDKMKRVVEKNNYGLAKNEKMVYSCLDLQPKGLEEIIKSSGLSVSACMSVLLSLELKGCIVQTSHQYYGKKQ